MMKLLLLGDVVGRPGREIVKQHLLQLREEHNVDFVVANCENVAGGVGVTRDTADGLFQYGVDVLTSGNHIWRKKEGPELLKLDPRILRPANYPDGVPGAGSTIVDMPSGQKVGVINLMGRIFMEALDCPFRAAEREIARLKLVTPVIIVDIHAEATSEKVAMGWFLDGQVSAVFGTHTHIPTADERILPKGTAFITDIGMIGPYDSVIGRRTDQILERFLLNIPVRSEVADGNVQLHGLLVDVNETTGKATGVSRIRTTLEETVRESTRD